MIRLWPWNKLRRSADPVESGVEDDLTDAGTPECDAAPEQEASEDVVWKDAEYAGSDDDMPEADVFEADAFEADEVEASGIEASGFETHGYETGDIEAAGREADGGEAAQDAAILDGDAAAPEAEAPVVDEIPWQLRDDLEFDPPVETVSAIVAAYEEAETGAASGATPAEDLGMPEMSEAPLDALYGSAEAEEVPEAAQEPAPPAPAPIVAAEAKPAAAPAPRPVLTFAYIVEPPDYEFMACTLLASIRCQFGPEVQAIGYCPEHRMGELHPAVLKAHDLMGSEVRPMRTEGMWDEDYPHGNKIIAAMQPRDSEYSAFVDSDVLFLRPNNPGTLVRPGHVSASKAASMLWGEDDVWDTIYGAFGMDVPDERIDLMRRGTNRVPYFSAGLVVFPETGENRFPDVWYDTARTLDRIEEIPQRRPYLDQQSLPVAIRRAGLDWNEIPEDHHFILGGKLRGEPLPDREIMTVHYRKFDILREAGLHKEGRRMLFEQTGEKYVRRLAETPEPAPADAG